MTIYLDLHYRSGKGILHQMTQRVLHLFGVSLWSGHQQLDLCQGREMVVLHQNTRQLDLCQKSNWLQLHQRTLSWDHSQWLYFRYLVAVSWDIVMNGCRRAFIRRDYLIPNKTQHLFHGGHKSSPVRKFSSLHFWIDLSSEKDSLQFIQPRDR